MFYLFVFFLLFDSYNFFDAIEKNVIIDSHYFDEFIIIDNYNFLGKHFSSDVYLIENGHTKYLIKQMEEDYYYEIEKDYLITILGNLIIQKNKLQGIAFSNIFYIPAFIESSIKKLKDKAALVIEYHEGCSFLSIEKNLQLKTNLPKQTYNEIEKGLSINIIDTIKSDDRFIFIAAFDTFFCNFDRHNENILYDFNQNIFFLIDQGGCYQKIALGRDIINSMQYIKKEYNYLLNIYFNYINDFYHTMSSKECIKIFSDFVNTYVRKDEYKNKMPLFEIINYINIHYFFIQYLLEKYYIINASV